MADLLKVFSGFLLLAMGVAIFILNIFYYLKSFILIIGLILALAGLYLIIKATNVISIENTKEILNDSTKSNTKLNKLNSKGITDSINFNLDKRNVESMPEFNFDSLKNAPEHLTNKVDNFYEDTNDASDVMSKAVLKVKPTKSNYTSKTYQFTPNYERPVKVTRRPAKKQSTGFDVSKIPESEKAHEIDEELVKTNDEAMIYNQNSSNYNVPNSDEFIEVQHDLNDNDEDYGVYNDFDLDDSEIYGEPFELDNTVNDIESKPVSLSKPNKTNDDEIKIDPNNPESLPIPKLLKSYVISPEGRISTQEASEKLSAMAVNNILLITKSLNDMSHKFLDNLSNVYTRIIVEDFDSSDLSTALVISSLIGKNVEIRTMPVLDAINLVIDDSYALIVSDDETNKEFQYGAVYSDKKSISDIKSMFESTWNIAEPVKEDLFNN
ncbi:hypothetical protein [Methanobrevibacter wolinii]|uniref:hypothetical protein n=1 Tax=Methanobrevibacter wolinii TaxID=190977 RepID=UPI0005B261BF|nr:hypothetical protein [Methanobrevibacter wolinii]